MTDDDFNLPRTTLVLVLTLMIFAFVIGVALGHQTKTPLSCELNTELVNRDLYSTNLPYTSDSTTIGDLKALYLSYGTIYDNLALEYVERYLICR